ncbi:MAG: carboxypeptidase regulatory-like domain-containing protein [Acidobacteriaceae bacterium]|nr:carboxypeptidase regulatory-like domain-containing protein [Acidobacteriaceae bacterium]MBV9778612.1 carboxypeptidase regulatory-like domain-containing protein [Acidobacteriaceae bacterium]
MRSAQARTPERSKLFPVIPSFVRGRITRPDIALWILLFVIATYSHAQTVEWTGFIRTESGSAVAGALIELRSAANKLSTVTDANGQYRFTGIPPGPYRLSVRLPNHSLTYPQSLAIPAAGPGEIILSDRDAISLHVATNQSSSGGETLSAKTVSGIPLNKRDFSQLLLLAAGTMTDANGASNFTQQFAINGQRGVEAVFAMDGADTSDPEMGGATFSNFNVDAVQEIQSSSGWMPTEIGHGAAGFTNIVTRSGTGSLHGSIFEFVRNSAFDARNFFDRRSIANPGRIPPFRRNEFGFTIGGPVAIPALYHGANRTQFFAEYQGFRQVLGTTQVLAVPTANERAGIDTTAFPGDTLLVPVNSGIASLINQYPLPNDPRGPFGARTFATSSKVSTDADQFSLRIDHQLTSKDRLFARVSINNLNGPITNPDQTAISPAFGILYVDHQRNAVLNWIRTPSASFTSESSVSFTRTTPSFPTPDHTDPELAFGDGLYEPFNAAAGSVTTSIGNLFQGRQNFTWTKPKHSVKAGAEFRANRDTGHFGITPNGQYTFGGGTAYSPVNIRSLSGLHNIAPGEPLPDTLTALLAGSAFAYAIAVAPPNFPQGDQIGVAAISRYNVNFFVQDTWKISDRFVLDYGLRYELYTPISERAKRTAGVSFVPGPNEPKQEYLINPQPRYRLTGNDWGPRLRISWLAGQKLWIRAGGAITTIPTNIWQDNMLTGAAPYVDYPRLTASPGAPLLFGTKITPKDLPGVFTPSGANILASGDSKAVPANTVWDIDRFERGIAALNPSHQITPLNVNVMSGDFRNAYLGTWTFALERPIGSLSTSAAYVGTAGISLPAINFPNAYPGATPAFAPYTEFGPSGQPVGGFSTELFMTNRSHSSYHSLQSSLQGTIAHGGPQIQASFTWSKSLDDTSTVIGAFISGASGATAPASPQNPFDTRADKGPSTFDVERAFTLTAIQDLHAERLETLNLLSRKITAGWQLLSVSTITSGPPFTVYSGVQQTGAGSNGVDRPDQIGNPDLSTGRKIREDYFGLGANNASFFVIPIDVPGGSGPNRGVFGSLGRDTFRGPALYNFDFAAIKDTPFQSSSGREWIDLQFRAEFFNLFNIANFGLPANTIKGSGFGEINRTAANSRQIQFSLKLMF